MMLILIPLAVWTFGAMAFMWPGNVKDHIKGDTSQYSASGVSLIEGTITKINETSCEGVMGSATGDKSRCAQVDVRIDEGPEVGQGTSLQLTAAHYASGVKEGQKVSMFRVPVPNSPAAYSFADFVRTGPMIFFTVLFALVVVAVARWRGLASLFGLVFAGFVLVKFMLPALIEGQNPVLVGLVASAAIMFVVLYAAHGFSARTTTALVGTLFGLALAAVLGWWGTRWTHLTGVASDDDFSLAAAAPDLSLTSVVICGVIVAGMGVLNDVTITQASAVWELAESEHNPRRLFTKAMRIGRDHIASSVYTIAFASAGAVLATLLLITVYQQPLGRMLVSEQFAAEIMRTLVGAIGLVLAVPLTTAVAVAVVGSSASGNADAIKPIDAHEDDELVDIHNEQTRRGASTDAYRRPTAGAPDGTES